MRRISVTAASAMLVLMLATTTSIAQSYPNLPSMYYREPPGVMTIAPVVREAYVPSYYAAAPAYPYGYAGNVGYGAASRSFYPSTLMGVPSQPIAPPPMPYADAPNAYRSYYRAAPSSRPNAAAIDVILPPDAKLWFQGRSTQQKGNYRVFESPPLDQGRIYTYEVRALWTNDRGEKVEWQRKIPVRAGAFVTLDLRKPER